jgi:hypothetical protein
VHFGPNRQRTRGFFVTTLAEASDSTLSCFLFIERGRCLLVDPARISPSFNLSLLGTYTVRVARLPSTLDCKQEAQMYKAGGATLDFPKHNAKRRAHASTPRILHCVCGFNSAASNLLFQAQDPCTKVAKDQILQNVRNRTFRSLNFGNHSAVLLSRPAVARRPSTVALPAIKI